MQKAVNRKIDAEASSEEIMAQLSQGEFLMADDDTPTGIDPTDEGYPSSSEKTKIKSKVESSMKESPQDKIKRNVEDLKGRKAIKSIDAIFKEFITVGQHTQDFEYCGHTFTFRSLDQNDKQEAIDMSNSFGGNTMGNVSAITFALIIFSLDAIDDISVYDMFSDSFTLNTFNNNKYKFELAVRQALRQYIGAFAPQFIDDLYDFYIEVEKAQMENISKLKNS